MQPSAWKESAHAENGGCAGTLAERRHHDAALDVRTTKKEALIKLGAIRNKIGYPDKWRDYSKLKIVRGDLIGNL